MKKIALSILGLYRYNPMVLTGIAFPEGVDIDTDILEWKILEECAELEVLYPDPDYMQLAIAKWAAARMPSWLRMYDTLTAEYNPIWNKDAEISEVRSRGPQQETRSYGQRQATTTNTVSAFNSAAYQPAEQNTALQNAVTDYVNVASVNERETRTEKGNIGVTTSQQMVQAEMELREKWNMYEIITEEFKKKFCLLVY